MKKLVLGVIRGNHNPVTDSTPPMIKEMLDQDVSKRVVDRVRERCYSSVALLTPCTLTDVQ